ncbi:MAG: hypothetical protein HKN14_03310 [Marinicaulis sp.]|nr:hypothetical protein [Marinicaulis sp.]
MKAIALINSTSGGVQKIGAEQIRLDIEHALRAQSIDFDIMEGGYQTLNDAVSNARDIDLVICAAGDGTQAALASLLTNRKSALLPLPCGTVNMFCRDLGIPLDLPDALAASLAGEFVKVDIGAIGERVFLSNVVFGAYADLAEAREGLRDAETIADVSFSIVEAADAILHADPVRYRAVIDGQKLSIHTNTIMVSNNAITHAENLVPGRASLSEGQLCIYLTDALHGGDFTTVLAGFIGGGADASDKIERRDCKSITLTATSDELAYTIDGDPIKARGSITATIKPKALTVLWPSKAATTAL